MLFKTRSSKLLKGRGIIAGDPLPTKAAEPFDPDRYFVFPA
jgi:hypothetical protein